MCEREKERRERERGSEGEREGERDFGAVLREDDHRTKPNNRIQADGVVPEPSCCLRKLVYLVIHDSG